MAALHVVALLIINEYPQIQFTVRNHALKAPRVSLHHRQAYTGILCLESHQQRRKIIRAEHGGYADANLAFDQPMELLHRQVGGRGTFKQFLGMAIENFTLWRQRDASPMTMEQDQPQLALKVGNRLADGRLGNMQFTGSATKAGTLGDRNKNTQDS